MNKPNGIKFTFDWYLKYFQGGDAGVEERTMAALASHFKMSPMQTLKFIYYYAMVYNIPNALDLIFGCIRDKHQLNFRTDRRYVRCGNTYERMIEGFQGPELQRKYQALCACKTTTEAYLLVRTWYYFGRYAAFMFLECWANYARPNWRDDLHMKWERDENYTKGGVIMCRDTFHDDGNIKSLDTLLDCLKALTGENVFQIETALCAVAKIDKGTRWNGYYKERLLKEASKSKWGKVIGEVCR